MSSGKARSLVLFITLIGAAVSASGKDIYVSPTGSDQNSGGTSAMPLRTIAAASKRAAPGDTVYLMPGQYQEAIIPVTSGTASQPITYKSAGPTPAVISHVSVGILVSSKAYLVFDGINVNGTAQGPNATVNSWVGIQNSNHITVKNGSFQYANGWGGMEISGSYNPNGTFGWSASGVSSYITIQDNKLDNVGDPMKPSGNVVNIADGTTQHVLVQRNIFTHGGHDLLEIFSDWGVVQDNVFNNDWRDLLGGDWGYRSIEVQGTYNVVQRNIMEHSRHGGSGRGGPLASIRGNQAIVRQNVFYDSIKEAIDSWCGAGVAAMANAHIYNNTMYQLGGSAWSMWAYSGEGCSPVGHEVFMNNLVVNSNSAVGNIPGVTHGGYNPNAILNFNVSGPGPGLVDLGLGPSAQSTVKGNLFLPSGNATRYVIFANAGGTMTLGAATSTFPQLFGANVDGNPSFVNSNPIAFSDLALQPSSPGMGTGVFLTNVVGSGSSTQLVVQDSLFFSDGNGVTTGDTIQLQGSTQQATIVSIDRASNTLTLSAPLSFKAGQGVALPYNGSAPDIGIGATKMLTIVPLPPGRISISPAH